MVESFRCNMMRCESCNINGLFSKAFGLRHEEGGGGDVEKGRNGRFINVVEFL